MIKLTLTQRESSVSIRLKILSHHVLGVIVLVDDLTTGLAQSNHRHMEQLNWHLRISVQFRLYQAGKLLQLIRE